MYPHETITDIQGTPTSLQIVWVDHEDDDDQFSIRIEQLIESYNRRLPPTRLLFVCPSGVEDRIQYSFRKHDLRGRLRSISHVSIAPFDSGGKVAKDTIVSIDQFKNTSVWHIEDIDVHKYAMNAVERIFDNTKTLLQAPHGYRFRKPSGREEDIFVRAGNLEPPRESRREICLSQAAMAGSSSWLK